MRARDDRALRWLIGGYVALRILAVRAKPSRWTDSRTYEHLDLTGAAERLPTVPLFFWLVRDDNLRVLLHAAIGVACFGFAALEVAARCHDRRVRIVAAGLVVGVGLTTQVTNFDAAILADSLSISLTVLLVAAASRAWRQPSLRRTAFVVGVFVLWVFVRETFVYVGFVLALVAAVAVVARRRHRRLPLVLLAVGLAVVAVAGGVADGRNTSTADFNLAGIIGRRLLPERSYRADIVDLGFPLPEGYDAGDSLGSRPILADKSSSDWIHGAGRGAYVRFLLTHPRYVVISPLDDLLGRRVSFAEENDSDVLPVVMLAPTESYARSRQVLPGPVEQVLFGTGEAGPVLVATVVLLLWWGAAWQAGHRDPRTGLPLLLVVLCYGSFFVVWHGSSIEVGRHSMPVAVALRLALILLGAALADGLVARRAPTSARSGIDGATSAG